MIKKLSKKLEFEHFTKLSSEWWDPNGKFKILHDLTPLRMKYIKEMISSKNDGNKTLKKIEILDIGCGGGLICEPLARMGANVTGIDFVYENILSAIKHAKDSNLNIKYLHKDIEKIKIDSKYDVIIILEVLEHIESWEKLITNISKSLKPKGKLIISTINRNLLSKIFAIFIAENILKFIPKKTHDYEKLIRPEELSSSLIKNKFNVLDITGLIFNPMSSEWILKKNNSKINYFCTAIKN
ncbi:MAG: Ubiquinone biosynthesis O-methyltransferase [Alphaproteobacteria bacterium MarineAlpha5_Bin6]|nr:MAG: Ubiquinone biosynthesis O-methyltransferase [Alphaproteobacteria bacterium MarineAlpha5_Bin7]PPR53846.1 MAG: Ubiquinone biosynthesis O-methyltransferase [Alphaproteobacteria bacterium MarineAlpha5_Bin6]|tara:strand:- start:2246 stop:2968 length:723 start_codon:yes stop_codon:yes gene_type:complete